VPMAKLSVHLPTIQAQMTKNLCRWMSVNN
jgi:hypothetical protein